MTAPITSVRLERIGGHDVLRVWNRGALAGELVLEAGDGGPVAALLMLGADSPVSIQSGMPYPGEGSGASYPETVSAVDASGALVVIGPEGEGS
jgi:hypothetical protein